MKIKSKILIIAGSDSSGGAGIQADIKTVTALGSYALTAITALTVQNTKGVKSVVPVSPNIIKNQIIYSAKDIKPDAIKIGMLHSKSVIKKVLGALNKLNIKKIVLDPVMIAKGGAKLIDDEAIKYLKKYLVSKVTIITPNIPEAEVLTGVKIRNKEDMILAANELIKLGAKSVLIKGGHLDKKVDDIFQINQILKLFLVKDIKLKIHMVPGVHCQLQLQLFYLVEKVLRKLVS